MTARNRACVPRSPCSRFGPRASRGLRGPLDRPSRRCGRADPARRDTPAVAARSSSVSGFAGPQSRGLMLKAHLKLLAAKSDWRRSGMRMMALVGLASVSTVTLAGCGGGEEGGTRQAEQLSQPERVAQAQRGTVSITGTGTAVDAEKKKVASEAGGSGVIIDAGRGLILTNNHVISGLTSARAKVGGSESTLQVVGRAPCQDLAVLRMTAPPSGIKQLKLGDSDKLKPGEHVTALGFPGSIEDEDFSDRSFSATEGSVSTVKTTVAPSDDYPRLPNVIRHQAPISSGNSGGPLLHDAGEVVGINTGSDKTEGSVSERRRRLNSGEVP